MNEKRKQKQLEKLKELWRKREEKSNWKNRYLCGNMYRPIGYDYGTMYAHSAGPIVPMIARKVQKVNTCAYSQKRKEYVSAATYYEKYYLQELNKDVPNYEKLSIYGFSCIPGYIPSFICEDSNLMNATVLQDIADLQQAYYRY